MILREIWERVLPNKMSREASDELFYQCAVDYSLDMESENARLFDQYVMMKRLYSAGDTKDA